MEGVERQILCIGVDGAVEFFSPRCRIENNGDGSYTITDLCAGPPSWVRKLMAAGSLDGFIDDLGLVGEADEIGEP